MKIEKIICTICLIALGGNALLLFEGENRKALRDQYNMVEYNLFQMKSINESQLKTNYTLIDKKQKVTTEKGDSLEIQEMLNNQDKFVIRFNDLGCSSCIENFTRDMPSIKSFIENIGEQNIIFLLNTTNPRDIIVF